MRTRKSFVRRASAVLVGMPAAVASAPVRTQEDQARNYTASGDAYTAKQQFKEAVIQYRRALAPRHLMPPTCTTSWGVLIRRCGDLVNAYVEYARAGDLDASNVDAQMRAGTILLLGREFETAATRAELALQGGPAACARARSARECQDGAERHVSGDSSHSGGIKLDPSYAPAWTALGAMTFISGRNADAAAAYQEGGRAGATLD